MRSPDSHPRCDADPTLAVLHGLRLKGFVDTAILVEHLALAEPSVDATQAQAELDRLAAAGLVTRTHRRSTDPASDRWSLSPAGRAEHERLLAVQLDASGQREVVQRAYRDFLALNPRLLDVCTRWQVRNIEASLVNDHTDPRYDASVIKALLAVHGDAKPILATLAAALPRFAPYGPALAAAVDQVLANNTDWFARPIIASYHTVWFELHEDLLATLGLERAAPEPAASTVG